MNVFLIYAACAIAGGFALRVTDPIIPMVAEQFQVSASQAALLTTCFAVPYALAQLILGPLGDRFGKTQCIRVCAFGLGATLLVSLLSPSFGALLSTRVLAGAFAGGLIPLVLASLGDQFEIKERQVMIGRMLFAIISGQMLGSVLGGLMGDQWGWWSALASAASVAVMAAILAWIGLRHYVSAPAQPSGSTRSPFSGYRQVFQNPKAPWVYACVAAEGILFFGFFPHISALLGSTEPSSVSSQAGLVLGAFGAGGLLYASMVRRLVTQLGMARMCLWGSLMGAACCALLISLPGVQGAAALLFAAGFGFYMLHNSLQTQATELSAVARASGVALLAFSFFAGQGLGPLVFGVLFKHWGMQGALSAMAVGMIVLGQVAMRYVCPPLKSKAMPAS
ncbi:MFS transporter [Ottowia thiooxydans]|uniref:DHA1 family inner membrane transport protein n=1 Tax=Ottowia thiooxydans TaxID=219182 RepID=A0ABV2QAV8_9BURK